MTYKKLINKILWFLSKSDEWAFLRIRANPASFSQWEEKRSESGLAIAMIYRMIEIFCASWWVLVVSLRM